MSRLGKQPVAIPEKVEVSMADGTITVKGPNGTLSQKISDDIKVVIDDKQIIFEALLDSRQTRANHGLYRALANNMVQGVSEGFTKRLLLEGVGYRVAAVGNRLVMSIGFCHAIEYHVPSVVQVTVEGNTKIQLKCHDKHMLGQIASEIRSIRPPEPYKGKGIRYEGEVVRRKVGKAMSK